MGYFTNLSKMLFGPTWDQQYDNCLNCETPEEAIANIDWSYLSDYGIQEFISTAYWTAGFEMPDNPIAQAIADYCEANDPNPTP